MVVIAANKLQPSSPFTDNSYGRSVLMPRGLGHPIRYFHPYNRAWPWFEVSAYLVKLRTCRFPPPKYIRLIYEVHDSVQQCAYSVQNLQLLWKCLPDKNLACKKSFCNITQFHVTFFHHHRIISTFFSQFPTNGQDQDHKNNNKWSFTPSITVVWTAEIIISSLIDIWSQVYNWKKICLNMCVYVTFDHWWNLLIEYLEFGFLRQNPIRLLTVLKWCKIL